MLHIPRQNRRGGRVDVVHKSNIKADLVKQNKASSYESIEAILTFLEMLDSNNLIQHVKSPTHLNDHILDLIITRSEEDLVSETEVSSLISDHLSIHCSLALQKPPL